MGVVSDGNNKITDQDLCITTDIDISSKSKNKINSLLNMFKHYKKHSGLSLSGRPILDKKLANL